MSEIILRTQRSKVLKELLLEPDKDDKNRKKAPVIKGGWTSMFKALKDKKVAEIIWHKFQNSEGFVDSLSEEVQNARSVHLSLDVNESKKLQKKKTKKIATLEGTGAIF